MSLILLDNLLLGCHVDFGLQVAISIQGYNTLISQNKICLNINKNLLLNKNKQVIISDFFKFIIAIYYLLTALLNNS